MHTHIFGPNFQEKTFNFLIQFFIYLYLGTFLYYKGILAFILKHIMI